MYQCLMSTLKWFMSLFAHLKYFKFIQNISWLRTKYWQQSLICQFTPDLHCMFLRLLYGSFGVVSVVFYLLYKFSPVIIRDVFLSCHSFKIYWHPCMCCATLYKIIITVVRYLKIVAVLSKHFRPGHILKRKTCFWSWNWINCFNARFLAYFDVIFFNL